MLLVVLPLIVLWVFQRSETATRDWVGAGLDLDLMLHETFSSEAFAYTKFGSYLAGAATALSGPRRRRHAVPAARRARALDPGQGGC